jgi:hypothetical protein
MLNPDIQLEQVFELRQSLLSEILSMLQDSDPDVRRAAVRAGAPFVHLLESSNSFFPLQLPEIVLQNIYPQVYMTVDREDEKRSDAAIVDSLFKTMLDNCSGLLDAMRRLDGELQHTREGPLSSSSLLNVTTTRKIFEDEDPNPYRERALANQLATRSLMNIPTWPPGCTAHDELFALCSSCLDIIRVNMKIYGMAHEMTRFPTIFPALHGLISGVTVAIFLGANDESGSRASAKQLVDMTTGSQSSYVHPDILAALQNLAHAEVRSGKTEQAIVRSCFLLSDDTGEVQRRVLE